MRKGGATHFPRRGIRIVGRNVGFKNVSTSEKRSGEGEHQGRAILLR